MKPRTKEEHDFEQKTLADGITRDIDSLITGLSFMKHAIEKGTPQTYQMSTHTLMDLAIRWGQLCEMRRLSYAFQETA